MSKSNEVIQYALEKQLPRIGYDVIDFAEIPTGSDRNTAMQILDHALTASEENGYPGAGLSASRDELVFVVRVRPVRLEAEEKEEDVRPPMPELHQGLYLPDGKLNSRYLEHNAEVLVSCGEYALARNIYQTLLNSGERAGAALFGIGLCLENEGKSDLALKKYEESITYQPSLLAFRHMIKILVQNKKWEYAAETIERALSIKDLDESSRYEMHKAAGNCWSRIDRFQSAEKHYKKALAVRPNADEIRSNLGSTLLKEGKIQEARRAFEDAVASNSSSPKAHFGLALALLGEARKEEAYDALFKSLTLNLSNPTALFHLVRLGFELKKFGSTEQVVRSYVESNPVTPDLLYSLAALQFHSGKISDSKLNCERVLAMKAGHEGAHDLLTRIERFQG